MALALHEATVKVRSAILIDRVSLSVEAGRLTVIIGPNGAGKSTALAALAGDIPLALGRASLDGRDLRNVPRGELAERRAVIAQHAPISFPLMVHEIVALGRFRMDGGSACGRAVEEAMAAMDILPLAARDYSTLSGGERQRVQIARALAQLYPAKNRTAPRYLLMDEPTAHLDLKHQIAALETARRFADEGGGVLCILHDIGLAGEFADHAVLLKSGRIAAEGAPREVITPARIGNLFDISAQRGKRLSPLALGWGQ